MITLIRGNVVGVVILGMGLVPATIFARKNVRLSTKFVKFAPQLIILVLCVAPKRSQKQNWVHSLINIA